GGHIDLMPIYIAEGKRADNESKSEFALLLNAQLLTARTAVVHGVALGSSDFDQMQAAGSVLVWSPRSNVELYGETADVASAVRAGVPVLLAPDWSPTGSSNMLGELVYAGAFNARSLGGLFSARQLFEMTTALPARAAKIDDKVGALAKDKLADLFMLSSAASDPYEALLGARPEDVTLTMVN